MALLIGEIVGQAARMVPAGPDAVVLLGGATGKGNATSVETIRLAEVGEKITPRK